MNDPAVLRKIIAELELENKKLKQEQDNTKGVTNQFSSSFTISGGGGGSKAGGQVQQDKDWMKFGGQPLERPTTSSGNN
jgi:hypothetical protein